MVLNLIFGQVFKYKCKHVINHFLSLCSNIFEKNIKVFGPFSGNSKIDNPMDYIFGWQLIWVNDDNCKKCSLSICGY